MDSFRYKIIREIQLKNNDFFVLIYGFIITFSDWKNGRSKPKDEKLLKIADFFDVTLDYLRTGENSYQQDGYYLNEETAEMAQTLFENKNLRVLFDAAKDATPEDLETTYNMLMALKKKERGNNEF